MTNREIVKELTGEDAEDIFGGDCDNEMDEIVGVGDEKISDAEAEDMGRDLFREILVKLGHERGEISNKLVERAIMNTLWASLPKWKGQAPQF